MRILTAYGAAKISNRHRVELKVIMRKIKAAARDGACSINERSCLRSVRDDLHVLGYDVEYVKPKPYVYSLNESYYRLENDHWKISWFK